MVRYFQEIFDKVPMSKFDEYLAELIREGKKDEVLRLDFLLTLVKRRKG
jgi:hypothetical protein